MLTLLQAASSSTPASKMPFSDAGNSRADSKSGSKADIMPAIRPSLTLSSRTKSGSSKANAAKTNPGSSTSDAVMDVSGSKKQHWLGKAGSVLQRWTVPVKVKKEKKESRDISQADESEVIVID